MLPLYPAAHPTVGHERFASYFPHFSEIHTRSGADLADPGSKHQFHAADESFQLCSAPALASVSYRGLAGVFGQEIRYR